jgi:ABC-type dipeptide/oligopeptide/nickel transport system ATPase subunit/Holliday junction resolvase
MLQLQLTNFLCYDNLKLNIPLHNSVLIKGGSGQGKSSILKSIAWVLYGSNIKKIAPLKAPNAKTSVSLAFENISVTRSTHPKKLILVYNKEEYEDFDAQTKINMLFGQYDIWLATSYIQQQTQNNFLIASNAEKMSMLNMLAFHNDNPAVYIEKIDNMLQKCLHLQEFKLDAFNKQMVKFNSEDLSAAVHIINSQEEIDQINNDIITLNKERVVLQEAKTKRDIAMGIKNNKEEELKHLIATYDNQCYLKVQDTYTNTLVNNTLQGTYDKNNIGILEQTIQQLKTSNAIFCMLDKYDTSKTFYTDEDLSNSILMEKQYETNNAILKQFDLSHEQEEINNCISYYYDLLAAQDYLVVKNEYEEIILSLDKTKKELESINAALDKILTDKSEVKPIIDLTLLEREVNTLFLKLGDLKKQQIELNSAIKCPHCHNDVLYNNGTLCKLNNNIDIKKIEDLILCTNQEYNDKTIEIKKLKQHNIDTQALLNKYNIDYEKNLVLKQHSEQTLTQLTNKHTTLVAKLNTLKSSACTKVLKASEKEQIYNAITKLKSIKLTNKPAISSFVIKNALTYQEYSNKYKLIDDNYKAPFDISSYIEQLEKIIKEYKINYYKNETLYNNITTLQTQLEKIVIETDVSENLTHIDSTITNLHTKLINHNKAKVIIDMHNEVTLQREELVLLSKKIEALNQLKNYSIDIECKILQSVVDNINSCLFDVCVSLFDDLKMELSLFKTLKGGKNITKPYVNFNIYYKSGIFDSVNELSGGEKDRVSLAVTLSLNKLAPCKLMMFDEVTAGIGTELKNTVVKTVREHFSGTALYISYDGIEGIYDYIIDVDELQGGSSS